MINVEQQLSFPEDKVICFLKFDVRGVIGLFPVLRLLLGGVIAAFLLLI